MAGLGMRRMMVTGCQLGHCMAFSRLTNTGKLEKKKRQGVSGRWQARVVGLGDHQTQSVGRVYGRKREVGHLTFYYSS